MTDHQSSPDPFDRAAREAGEALRRPAPADGVGAVRAARRRHQIVLGAVGAAAVVLVVGAGVLVMTRGGGDEQVATLPDATVPTTFAPATTVVSDPTTVGVAPETALPVVSTTGPDPTTTMPAPTTTVPRAPATTTLVAWGDAQRAAGRTDVNRLPADGGDAAGFLARLGSDDVAGAVALRDGRVVEMPPEVLPSPEQDISLFDLGGKIAIVKLSWGDDTPPDMTILDPAGLTWSAGPDLGFEPADGADQAWYVDGSLLIGQGIWEAAGDDLVPAANRSAVIVRPDLSVEQVATPPDGVQTTWSSVSGHVAFTFGHAGVGTSFTYSPSPQPWSFDVQANAWSPVPNPEWMTCPDGGCDWKVPTDGLPPVLEVGTDAGVVKLLLDGTIGLYDPDLGTWRRLDDAPFELALPQTAVIGDLVVVAPAVTGPPPLAGVFAVLDVANGFWLSGGVELADDDAGFWLLRHDDDAVLLTRPSSSWPSAAVDTLHDVVVDADTPTGRVVSASEVPRWYPLSPFFDLTEDELA